MIINTYMYISEPCFSFASVLILNKVLEAGAQVMLKYLSTKPHNYTVCQQVKDMLEIRCHTDTRLHIEEN